jgi:hypothetical protein
MARMTSFLIDPACDFDALRRRLDPLHWRLVSAGTHPILPGEPEHAIFERDAGERTHYTFNPVCRLRVLEFAGHPDAATSAALPAAGAADIATWLDSADERTLLRGLLAARLKPDPRFAGRVAALAHHSREAIADAAARTGESIRFARAASGVTLNDDMAGKPDSDAEERVATLAMVEVIKRQVEPLLMALSHDDDGSVVASLRPRAEDYARVFVPEIVDRARAAYEMMWADPPRIAPLGDDVRIECHVAPAGMFRMENELSRPFPGGYLHIARLLNPQRTWVRWKYLRAGDTAGIAFDGLVWCEDHWAWFPKPFRVLTRQQGV